MQKVLCNIWFSSSKNMISSAYLSVKIGGSLVYAAYTKHRRETGLMARTVEAYMVSLAAFEILVTKDCEVAKNFSKKDRDVHLTSLQDKRTWISSWLNSFDFLYRVKEDLRVSMFCIYILYFAEYNAYFFSRLFLWEGSGYYIYHYRYQWPVFLSGETW